MQQVITRMVTINGPHTLEGLLVLPGEAGCWPGVVVLHPHPLYGGNMENNVVQAVAKALGQAGLAVLCFNFRGVGKSQGSYSQGVGEQEDAVAALDWLAACPQVDPANLGLAGYSFGCLVGLPVAVADSRVKALAAIAPFGPIPPGLISTQFPKLVVVGSRDHVVDIPAWQQAMTQIAEPNQMVTIEGMDHFWRGREQWLGEQAADFFSRNLILEQENG